MTDETKTFFPERGDAPEALVGTILAGRYRLQALLGVGAMGVVYLGQHLKIGRKDAIKILHSSLARDPDAIARFDRGAKNVGAIQHPNVCVIYDFSDTDTGLQYLAMEYVPGETLKALLDRVGPLPLHRSLRIAEQVAAALQAAHHANIVHRDLKPANIMITVGANHEDIVKVVDFDISKGSREGIDPEVTRHGYVVGTPEYMSPEQLLGTPLDGRSDLYSLTLVLCRMLTGLLPFRGSTLQERLSDQPLARLSELAPGQTFPPKLQELIDSGLQRWAPQRISSAAEFVKQIRLIVAEAETRALPLPALTVTKPGFRFAGWRAIGVAGVVVLGISGALAAWKVFGDDTVIADNLPQPPRDSAPPTNSIDRTPPDGPRPFTFAPVRLRVGVNGLPSTQKDRVSAIVRGINGAVLVDNSGETDLNVQASADGVLSLVGGGGQESAGTIDTGLLAQLLKRELATLTLASLDRDGSDDVFLQFAGGKRTFVLTEQIRFRIRSAAGGFLTLVDISPDGVLTVLHPNRELDIGRFTAGQEKVFPGPADPTFEATLPTGTGVVRAIFTDAPLPLKRGSQDFLQWRDGPAGAREIRSALAKLATTGGPRWSTGSVTYMIQR